jgi:hypothetical protein
MLAAFEAVRRSNHNHERQDAAVAGAGSPDSPQLQSIVHANELRSERLDQLQRHPRVAVQLDLWWRNTQVALAPEIPRARAPEISIGHAAFVEICKRVLLHVRGSLRRAPSS